MATETMAPNSKTVGSRSTMDHSSSSCSTSVSISLNNDATPSLYDGLEFEKKGY